MKQSRSYFHCTIPPPLSTTPSLYFVHTPELVSALVSRRVHFQSPGPGPGWGAGGRPQVLPIRRCVVRRSATVTVVSLPLVPLPSPPPLPSLSPPVRSGGDTICRRGINITWSVGRCVSPPANYQFFIVADICKGYRGGLLSSIPTLGKQRWTAGCDQRGGRVGRERG